MPNATADVSFISLESLGRFGARVGMDELPSRHASETYVLEEEIEAGDGFF